MASKAAVAVNNINAWTVGIQKRKKNNSGCGDAADILVTNTALHAGAKSSKIAALYSKGTYSMVYYSPRQIVLSSSRNRNGNKRKSTLSQKSVTKWRQYRM